MPDYYDRGVEVFCHREDKPCITNKCNYWQEGTCRRWILITMLYNVGISIGFSEKEIVEISVKSFKKEPEKLENVTVLKLMQVLRALRRV